VILLFFKGAILLVQNDKHPGCPSININDELVVTVCDIVQNGIRLTIHEMAEGLGI
jgi:hypothetical protein